MTSDFSGILISVRIDPSNVRVVRPGSLDCNVIIGRSVAVLVTDANVDTRVGHFVVVFRDVVRHREAHTGCGGGHGDGGGGGEVVILW